MRGLEPDPLVESAVHGSRAGASSQSRTIRCSELCRPASTGANQFHANRRTNYVRRRATRVPYAN